MKVTLSSLLIFLSGISLSFLGVYSFIVICISIIILLTFNKTSVERMVEVFMPTKYGSFRMVCYQSGDKEHLALVKGDVKGKEGVLVRVHSSCITGDIFGSCRCDCGHQLHSALQRIDKEGCGALIYMNQEGRGIGLVNKLKAYVLQEKGRDTIQANLELGFKDDERDYKETVDIINNLGIKSINLLTNNPTKQNGLLKYNLKIDGLVKTEIDLNEHNEKYLKTKKEKMSHQMNI